MPTVDVDPDELTRLTGKDVPHEELLADLFSLGLEYEGETEAGELELELGADRLDRLSVEGIARSLRYHYGIDRGVYVPNTVSADWTAIVDDSVPPERPYVSAFIARDVSLTESVLDSLIQLQEKLHRTIGRQRTKGAIGMHDLTMLKGAPATDAGEKTLRYVGIDPDEEEFVPLEATSSYTPARVIEEHHIGREYGHLVESYSAVPAIYDDIGLFSLPPIINSRRTAVTTDTGDVLIELTGTDQWTIDRMGTILAYAFDARGAQLEDVAIEYDDDHLTRPDLAVRTKHVRHDRIEQVMGIDLATSTVVDLFERAGLAADKTEEGRYAVQIPPYRVDVLHPLDLIDDLGRAYGFNDLEPQYPRIGTIGGRTERSRGEDVVREQLIGLGFQDLVNFHLIGTDTNFELMSLEAGSGVYGGSLPARIAEPYSEEYEIVRTWALPSLMQVLGNNSHHRYPQYLAEVGFVAHLDASTNTGVAEERSVAAVLADTTAGFEDAKTKLQFLAREHGCALATPSTDHPSFLEGRAASVELDGEAAGIIGEIHPRLLERLDLEVPVAAFEFSLTALLS